MSKHALLPLLLILSLLTAGCQALPELLTAVESITSPTETQSAEIVEPPILTATLAEPTTTAPLPTETPTATPTETTEPVFVLQPGSPMYMANFAHPAADATGPAWAVRSSIQTAPPWQGCSWSQVTSPASFGRPRPGFQRLTDPAVTKSRSRCKPTSSSGCRWSTIPGSPFRSRSPSHLPGLHPQPGADQLRISRDRRIRPLNHHTGTNGHP